MREIKFRGKRLDNGEWIYGDLLHIAGGCIIYYGSQTESELIEDKPNLAIELYMDEVTPVDPDTVGQFTGMFDRNGREIYEGDILKITISKSKEVKRVAYSSKQAAFGIQYPDGVFFPFSYDLIGASEDNYKVIGNIHDNPSLLKGDEQ